MGKVQQTEGPYWSKAWIQKLWEFTNQNFVDFDSGTVDFEALGREEFEFRKAMFFRNFKNSQRAKEAFDEAKEVYEKRVKAGEQGGRPKSSDSRSLPQKTGSVTNRHLRCPTTKEEFRQFVYDQDLNISLSEDWYAIHEERDWTDNEGGPLKNWKGALTNYCRSRENQLRGNHD